MSTGYRNRVISIPATQFIEALAQDEISANYDLTLPAKTPAWLLKALTLVAVQNLAYELWLFSSAVNLGVTVETDRLIGVWQFAALGASDPGAPVNDSALFHYYVDGNDVPIYDEDFGVTVQALVHARLVNRSVTGKNADAAGAVQLTLHIAPQGQQV